MTPPKPYTVSAITRMIKATLEESFASVWVEGEISGYLHHSSGHRYFSLKDENAVLKCTLWRSAGGSLKFEPENGQKVLAYGNISLYEKSGQYQLNCRKLVPVGIGALELAFRQLHEKLSREGLFDPDRKRDIPAYPMRMGVVTSPTGAAIRDIINITRRRNRSVQLILFPAQVQGDGAEHTIKAGIDYFNTRDDIDLIITGRGGGSLEDLWCFNTELVVRAIAASRIPVISAVGHEIDTTLSDYVADLRVPTPSAAAEQAVWLREDFENGIQDMLLHQASLLNRQVKSARQHLSSILTRPIFARPFDMINQRAQYLDQLIRLADRAGKNRFEKNSNRLSLALSRLNTLSPLNILARGYSVTRKPSDKSLIKSIEQVAVDDKIETILSRGKLIARVVEVKKNQ
jgi:exodeoxyribonuclease VII large subunit